MSSPQPVGYIEGDLHGMNTTKSPMLVGPWQLAYGGASVRTGIDVRQISGNFECRVAWRTAPVDTNFPNAWNEAGTNVNTAKEQSETFSLSGQTALWVQAGVFAGLKTGTTPATARVRMWSAVVGSGWIAARQRVVLEPGLTNAIVPIGNPFSSAGVTGLMYGFSYTGISGTLTAPTPTYRVFAGGDFTLPGAWQTLTPVGSNVTADSKVVDDRAVTTTSSLYTQAGLKFSSTSLNYGVVDVLVAAKV